MIKSSDHGEKVDEIRHFPVPGFPRNPRGSRRNARAAFFFFGTGRNTKNTGSCKYFAKINDRLNIRLPPFWGPRRRHTSCDERRRSPGRRMVRKRDKIMYQTSNYIKLFRWYKSRDEGDTRPATEEDGSLSLQETRTHHRASPSIARYTLSCRNKC